jgi:hypothetical protein
VLSSPLSPAVAALGATAAPAGNRVTLTGDSLGDGTEPKIVLTSADFAALVPPLAEAVVDPASNPAWAFLFKGSSVEFSVQPTVNAEAPGGFTVVPIRPGIYAIAIRHERRLATEEGETTVAPAESNVVPFAVGPAIAALTVAGGRVRIDLRPGVDCTDPLNVPQLTVTGEVYRFVAAFTGVPADDAGTFIAASASRYEAAPLFNPTDGATRMVRLAVNGVDAPPDWLEP